MERTMVYLDTPLKRRLREEAQRRGTSEAAVLREALVAYLAPRKRAPIKPVGQSKDGGAAHRVDEALDELGFGRK
jgi:hypothetical protein